MKKHNIKNSNIYPIKATLSDWQGKVEGKPFRVLATPKNFTLYKLPETIVDSFNFDFDHPFGFYDSIKKRSD